LTIYGRRRAVNTIAIGLALGATGAGLAALAAILFTLFVNGIGGVDFETFTMMTPPPGSSGGLLNPIAGSIILTLLGTMIATPVGIMAGTFLAEFGHGSRLASVTRFVSDVLLSAPSIVIGLFVYELMVVRMGHFSGIAGTVALAVIAVPIIVRTTEDMLSLVPGGLREAAIALGAPRWRMVVQVAYRAAKQGILTGVLLAVARMSGETAPLLFTALNNQFWSLDMSQPMASLPIVIFQFAMSPYDDWHRLAWSGALLITLGVLGLTIVARTLISEPRR
jgi:phosphate transport system permease protein